VVDSGTSPGAQAWRLRRRRRTIWSVGSLLVVIAVITVWPRGQATDEVATGPSPETTRPVDTAPFELPRNDGPTTIPDDQLETTSTLPPPVTRPPTTQAPTTQPPPTTTLPPTTTTTLPYAPPDDLPCQALLKYFELIVAAPDLRDRPRVLAELAYDRLTEALILLRRADDPVFDPTIDFVGEVRKQVRAAQTLEEIIAVIDVIVAPGKDPRLAPMVEHSRKVCPAFLLA
jgi:hypothetical protein